MRANARRFLIVGLPALAAVLLAAWAVVRPASSHETDEVVEVRLEPFLRRIDAKGEVRSANSAVVGCPSIPRTWNFTITVLAPEGQSVQAGTPLVRFDDRTLRENLQVRSSELETTSKELEKTELEEQEKLERLLLEEAELKARKARLERKLAVPEELLQRVELAKTHIDDALADEELRLSALRIEAQRASMQARIETARNKVEYLQHQVQQLTENGARMAVLAPRDGFVSYLTDWDGNKPKVGESVWVGRSILEVADLDHMQVAAEVAEPDSGFVEVGQTAEIRLDASPGRLFTGRVASLGRLFRTKSDESPSMVFDAVVSIDEADPALMRPGMAASVQLLAPTRDEVLHVPEDAVRRVAGEPRVELVRPGGRVEAVAVRLGPRWDGRVIVEHGLNSGDKVRAHARGG